MNDHIIKHAASSAPDSAMLALSLLHAAQKCRCYSSTDSESISCCAPYALPTIAGGVL